MRVSHYLLATQKETPHDAEIISHQLMLRAGMIRKLGSGLYTWLPLGLRVLKKVEQVVREEMDRSGAMEVFMPAVQPAELWHETGRWETFGGQLLKIQDNAKRDYCFGPTHEEVITDLMRNELNSYKQLPCTLYQVQTKFRDEIRPRFGVMRAREFIMKDAYSFHIDQHSLAQTYDVMYDTYSAIFTRLGLEFRAVEADTGAIGGSASHEFQVLADSGEDVIFYSNESDYAANVEQASYFPPEKATTISDKEKTLLDTPDVGTIEEVAKLLNVTPQETIKTLIVEGIEQPLVAIVLRGDHELNAIKAEKHPLIKAPLQLASEESIKESIGASIGSLGPCGLSMPILADHSAAAMCEFVCGANQDGKHFSNVSWQRDAIYTESADLRNVLEGDLSPDGHGHLKSCRGIEVGHIFQLGSKYAKDMNATVLNEQGKASTLLMGCYGIGISRIVAAAIEQNHDEHGIIWPQALAPFQISLVPMNMHKSESVRQAAESLYVQLQEFGFDVLFDDRNERAGTMFADSELIGIPHRFVISERNLKENCVEYKARSGGEKQLINLDELPDFLQGFQP